MYEDSVMKGKEDMRTICDPRISIIRLENELDKFLKCFKSFKRLGMFWEKGIMKELRHVWSFQLRKCYEGFLMY